MDRTKEIAEIQIIFPQNLRFCSALDWIVGGVGFIIYGARLCKPLRLVLLHVRSYHHEGSGLQSRAPYLHPRFGEAFGHFVFHEFIGHLAEIAAHDRVEVV